MNRKVMEKASLSATHFLRPTPKRLTRSFGPMNCPSGVKNRSGSNFSGFWNEVIFVSCMHMCITAYVLFCESDTPQSSDCLSSWHQSWQKPECPWGWRSRQVWSHGWIGEAHWKSQRAHGGSPRAVQPWCSEVLSECGQKSCQLLLEEPILVSWLSVVE